ncbi:MAG TPA: 5-(carboxyamino)imidazole ribonucleotide synthase [Oscillatoriales cyanobacterium M59_W2019_021]|nr:5-(carboxyamino)imidazole ribonucleotide synthase [Oscillatoriales cyanobacterium M59_W2019_021]
MQLTPTFPEQNISIARVGVIGGGQLAWMMAGEAPSLGLELVVQTPNESDPASPFAAETVLGAIDDATATAQLAKSCQVITFENEFVDLPELAKLERQGVCFRPALKTLEPLLDKYMQRCFLRELGLPVPEFFTLDPGEPIPEVEFPIVMKARRHGYDGQGTAILKDRESLEKTWERWGYPPVILEAFVPFDRELAAIAARNSAGEIAIYPIVETQQEEQVCRRVLAPAEIAPSIVLECEAIARTLLERTQAIGIFGIELFLTPDGKVWVNEIAPRTHNSGHFSLDACRTSQFEQHLRAVSDRPLGSPELLYPGAVMVNLLGYESARDDYCDKRRQLAEIPNARVRWYGKSESRPGRKLGHVTIPLNAPDFQLRKLGLEMAKTVEAIWYG